MKPSDVSQWIASAPFDLLLAALHEGLAGRADRPRDDGHTYVVGLAVAANDGSGWEFSIAAPPDGSAYEGPPPDGEPWCQFGVCPTCDLELTGAVKRAQCSNCGGKAQLT